MASFDHSERPEHSRWRGKRSRMGIILAQWVFKAAVMSTASHMLVSFLNVKYGN